MNAKSFSKAAVIGLTVFVLTAVLISSVFYLAVGQEACQQAKELQELNERYGDIQPVKTNCSITNAWKSVLIYQPYETLDETLMTVFSLLVGIGTAAFLKNKNQV